MFTAKIPPEYDEYLDFIWKMLSDIAMEARFTVDNTGILIQASDPASTTYAEVKVKKGFFRQLSGKAVFFVNTQQTARIPSSISKLKGTEIELSDDKSDFFYEKIYKNYRRKFSTIKIVSSYSNSKYPKIQFVEEAEILMSTRQLKNHICNAKPVDDKITVECNSSQITFRTKGELSSYHVIHKPRKDEYIITQNKKTTISETYFVEYICSFLEHTSKLFDDVLIRFAKGKPLELKTEKLDLIEVKALFAPVP